MAIWFSPDLTIDKLKSFTRETMEEQLGIEYTGIGEDWLEARMPVDRRTRQAYGILHGGANVTLAESMGSIGSAMIIDPGRFYCVGLEINANHVRSAREGFVKGIARPLHLGGLTHIWEIKISDEKGALSCISRLTVAILRKS